MPNQSRPPHGGESRKRSRWKKVITWLTLKIFTIQPLLTFAQAVADPNAAGQNKPIVENTANGIPIVQIATPSAAGVSRNQYSQFSVDAQGLILNNATTVTQTQLAGYVDRNVRLGNTPARVILNEVTSSNPSYLRGYTEVAGQKADVIIANPNGIYGDGFGFINTSRATLTTGTPIFGGTGSLEAFRVTGGQIAITGQGLDASNIDRVDLISRATTVNAGIWANQLNVVTGANKVDYATLATEKITGDADQPAVSLDVSALGGMYANKICLVGTEQGVGVNSQGVISATGGDLIFTQDGKIILTGNTTAAGNIQIQTQDDLTNQGTLYAQGNTHITTPGTLENTGTLAAQQHVNLSGQNVTSSGLLGAGINDDGTLNDTGDLTITASQNVNTRDQNLAAGNIQINAAAIDLADSTTYAGGDAELTASAGNIEHTGATTQVEGALTVKASGSITNRKNASGTGGELSGATMNLTASGDIINQGAIDGNIVTATSQNFNNTATILGDVITINADTISNSTSSAIIASTEQINLYARTALENINGATLYSMGDINIAANGQRDADGYLTNRTAKVVNEAAIIEADGNLNLAAEQVENRADNVEVATRTTTSAKTLLECPHFSYLAPYNPWFGPDRVGPGEEEGEARVGNRTEWNGRAEQTVASYRSTTYYKLTLTVDAANVISYDPATGKIVFRDPSQTYFTATNLKTGKQQQLKGPILYSGKQAGITTAYYDSIQQTADGNYIVKYYPGYNPNYYLHPEKVRYVATDRSSGIPEIRRKTTTTVTTEYIENEPNIGHIRVGQNLNLNIGEKFLNQYSEVAVGDTVQGNIGTLENQGYRLQRTSKAVIDAAYYGYYHRHGLGRTWGWTHDGPYQTVEYIDGGLPATFIANKITAVGTNVKNIQVRPDGTASGSGSTLNAAAADAVEHRQSVQDETAPPYAVPQNGLYTIHPEPDADYLIETDSRFTDRRQFLSSNYMLQRTTSDPEKVLKRLGDGFYEQKLVTDQITQLTGRRFLEGYTNAEDEFKALMDAGIETAASLQLRIGITLTAEQINALTQDIVWMVEEEVTLPNGQTAKVLVPKVYLSPAHTIDLQSSGALISANEVNLTLSGNLDNSGTIASNTSTQIKATDIINRDGQMTSDGSMTLIADHDIINQSGTISGSQVTLQATHDIRNETTTRTISDSGSANGQAWAGMNTVIGQQGTIQSTGDIAITAGHDVTINGAAITADGDVDIKAENNLTIGTVVAQSHAAEDGKGTHHARSSTTHVTSAISSGGKTTLDSTGDTVLTGAAINAGTDLTIKSAGNITITAVIDSASEEQRAGDRKERHALGSYDEDVVGSTLTANNNITITAQSDNADQGNVTIAGSHIANETGTVAINADHDVTIQEVSEKHETYSESWKKTSSGLTKTTTAQRDYSAVNLAEGSTISGDAIKINAGNDLTLQGSQVIGSNEVALSADNDVNITTAEETYDSESYFYQKTSGLSVSFSGGVNAFAGTTSQESTTTEHTVNQAGSTVGSLAGNVTITAGNDATITGSDVIGQEGIDVTAQNITIDAATNTSDIHQTYEFKQTGLTISVGNTFTDKAGEASSAYDRSQEVANDWLEALYGLKAYRAADKAKDLAEGNKALSELTMTVGFGSTKQESETTTHITSSVGSSLSSRGTINLTATGSGANATDGDLNIIGSSVNGENVTLAAANDINLKSSADTMDSHTESSGKSVGIGVTTGVGKGKAGTSMYIEGSKSSGVIDETSTTYNEATITANNTLTIKSGRDTNLEGAQASGETVVADVGRDLNIISQQDTQTYHEENKSASAKVGTGGSTAGSTASANKGKIDSTYQSVNEQSGIFAGTGGFDIEVEGNTDLKGAVIASEADAEKNTLSTGTLTFSDLENKAEYEASSKGINVNTNPNAEYNEQGITPDIGVPASDDANSTTKSAISLGTIDVRNNPNMDLSNLSRDTANAVNALDQIFDKKTVQEQQELSKMFGEEAYKLVGEIAKKHLEKAVDEAIEAKKKTDLAMEALKKGDQKGYEQYMSEAKALLDDAQDLKSKWESGGSSKIALHALVGGVMADMGGASALSGAVGAGVNEATQKALQKIKEPDLQQWGSLIIGGAASAVVGGDAQTGGSTAVSGTVNNEQILSHRAETEIVNQVAKDAKFVEGFAEGLKGKAEEIRDPLLNSKPEDIDRAIANIPDVMNDLIERGLVKTAYDATLGDWRTRYDEIQSITDPEERGKKSAELLADIGATLTLLRQAGKAVMSFSELVTPKGPGGAVNLSKSTNPKEFLDTALKKQGLETAPKGLKETWIEGDYKYEVRIHEANPEYGKSGSIYRVSRQKINIPEGQQGTGVEYMDANGTWHHQSTLKPGKNGNINPNYNDNAARETHIQVD